MRNKPSPWFSQADANLILAAHDLYGAAKAALEKCQFAVGSMKVKEMLEAAIKKAEGL